MPNKDLLTTADSKMIDVGLLLLRAGVGLSLCLLFGLTKLKDAAHYLHTGQWSFVDFNRKVGLPLPVVFAFLQTMNESFVALMVACGLWTRYAAASLLVGFTAAACCSLKMHEGAWLIAAYVALMFATIALTGPGRFSIDSLLTAKAEAKVSSGLNR